MEEGREGWRERGSEGGGGRGRWKVHVINRSCFCFLLFFFLSVLWVATYSIILPLHREHLDCLGHLVMRARKENKAQEETRVSKEKGEILARRVPLATLDLLAPLDQRDKEYVHVPYP